MAYLTECCNCYFDMYLLKINVRPEIMDPERKNLLSIIRTRGKKKEWKLKNDLLEQWFHIKGEIIFHSCFNCDYKVLQNSEYRKKPLF